MRDIARKIKTLRTATAEATLRVNSAVLDLIKRAEVPKGDPLSVAKVAAVQAAKNTSQIIPYCHPLPIDYVGVDFKLIEDAILIVVTVKVVYKTGVEMEALTAASVAALTLYDMLKMLDKNMEIVGVRLLSKSGGKSDFKDVHERQLRAAVLVMSDSIAAGHQDDLSGKLIVERLVSEGLQVEDYRVIPDDLDTIVKTLVHYCDDVALDMVLTTGGTGLSPRDHTPEAMASVIERPVIGITEAVRAYGQERNPLAMLSRSTAGVRKSTLIVNLPGSKRGVADSLDALFPGVLHVFHVLAGGDHKVKQKKQVQERVN